MIEKISNKVYKVVADSNLYFLDLEEKIVIDTGNRAFGKLVEQFLGGVVNLNEIDKVLFTHLHYDHIGNFDLFSNASFYASKESINCLKKDRLGTVLNSEIASIFDVGLRELPDEICGLKVISVPGHSSGSVAFWFEEEKILFSGDTLFFNGMGRLDLPTSVPSKMEESLDKLKGLGYKVLCPGHDY